MSWIAPVVSLASSLFGGNNGGPPKYQKQLVKQYLPQQLLQLNNAANAPTDQLTNGQLGTLNSTNADLQRYLRMSNATLGNTLTQRGFGQDNNLLSSALTANTLGATKQTMASNQAFRSQAEAENQQRVMQYRQMLLNALLGMSGQNQNASTSAAQLGYQKDLSLGQAMYNSGLAQTQPQTQLPDITGTYGQSVYIPRPYSGYQGEPAPDYSYWNSVPSQTR